MRDNKIHPGNVRRPKVTGGSSLQSLSHTVAPGKERSTNVIGNEMHGGGATAYECMILRRIELLVSVKRYRRACISCNCLIFIYLWLCTRMSWCICGGQRTTCRGHSSSSTQVPGKTQVLQFGRSLDLLSHLGASPLRKKKIFFF